MSAQIVRARGDSNGAILVLDEVESFLRSAGVATAVSGARRIGDGQSNFTFALDTDAGTVILRRGPRPPLPPSAHDMVREARVLSALGGSAVAVPRVLAVCNDNSVLGVPFYVMNEVVGDVITDTLPDRFDQRRPNVAFAAVDALADLHTIDITPPDIAALGRADGYLHRQIERFAGLWPRVTEREMPEVARLGALLQSSIPTSQRPAVVHGDFRLGNLMFSPGPTPHIASILDWEMATLGDPLADLGYFTATYSRPGSDPTPLELTPVTREPGFPETDDLVLRYAHRTGLDVSKLAWYEALALWKAAVFCEAIHTRWRHGERPGDTFGPRLTRGVPDLLAAAERRLSPRQQ